MQNEYHRKRWSWLWGLLGVLLLTLGAFTLGYGLAAVYAGWVTP